MNTITVEIVPGGRERKMLRIDEFDCWGFEHAIRGMRNPMNSWKKSDSEFYLNKYYEEVAIVGPNDLELMKKLVAAGPVHRKFLRQIFIAMDIVAPLYWWKEFDTYKVGTVANSCSTMHKIHDKEFTLKDFSFEHLTEENVFVLQAVIETLNYERDRYLETKDKDHWWQMIQLLPSSYNQRRTVTMSYENALNICMQRKGHKLDEWETFINNLFYKGVYIKEFVHLLEDQKKNEGAGDYMLKKLSEEAKKMLEPQNALYDVGKEYRDKNET